MSLMWMPPHTTVPPFATALSAAGTSAPTGAKMSAASSSSGGGPSESPAHSAPSSSANALRLLVARAREGEHAPPLVERHLGDDVRRGAEAVDAEPLGVAGQPQRAVADQAGAQERRRLDVVVAVRAAGSRSARRPPRARRSRRRCRSR